MLPMKLAASLLIMNLRSPRLEHYARVTVRYSDLRINGAAHLTPSHPRCSFGIRNSVFPNWTPPMIALDPTPNLIDQVYARILEAITDRTLPPGHRIRQNEFAEKLGVSRQPVSHALHLLHRQGLLAESGRRGFEVTQLDPARIRQLYEVRGAIDALAARLAAKRVKTDAAGRKQLEAALHAGRDIDKKTPLAQLI